MRTLFVRSLFSILSFLTFTPGAVAGPVTGRLVDPDARAVPGATVLVVHDTYIAGTTVTDNTGAFRIHAPDEGSYEIRVAVYGFRATPLTLDGQTASRDVGSIALEISAVTESAVVSASQAEVPLSMTSSSVSVITGAELLARQVESLQDALRLVPGLTVSSSGGRGALVGLFPRGGESDYSLVLVDGVPANAFGGGFDFAHLPAVNIDRIEIVRGPQSALYGSNAIGSVIRVITRRGGPPVAQGSIEGGSFGTMRMTGASAGSAGPWQWGASAERLSSDGLNGDATQAGETISNDDYDRHSLSAGVGWIRQDRAGIRGDVRFMSDERGFPGPFGSNPLGFYGGIDTESRGTNNRWLVSLSGATPPTRRVRAHAQLTHGRIDGVFKSSFDPDDPSESWSRRTAGRLQIDTLLRQGLDSSVGIEVQRERVGGTFITASGSREVPVERSLTGAFAEARWNPTLKVFVTGGLRIERITRSALSGNLDSFASRPDFPDDTVVSVNPKLAAAWFVRSADGDYTKLRGSAGTGIRPPDGFEIAFTDNPALKPERSRSFDVGIDQSLLSGQLLLESTAFFNDYDDLIIAVGSFSASSRYRTDNISNARSKGLEVAGTARMRWVMDVQLRVGYTLLSTEVLAVDQGPGAPPPFTPGDALLRRPRHQFAVDAVVSAGRLTGFIQGGGRNSVRDVEPSSGTFGGVFESAGFSVWNAGVTWRVVEQVHVFGRVNNLWNRDYEEVFGFPALPRGVFAGVRVAAGR